MTPGVRPLIAGNWKMHGTLREAAGPGRRGGRGRRRRAGGGAAGLPALPPSASGRARRSAGAASRSAGRIATPPPRAPIPATSRRAMLRDVGAALRHPRPFRAPRRPRRDRRRGAGQGRGGAGRRADPDRLRRRDRGAAPGRARPRRWSRGQLDGSLPEGFAAAGGVVAYEPVWAIGTGRTPTEADIAAIHAAIRGDLRARFGAAGGALRMLYGGSVKPGNAAAILALPNVDGALVGGASLSRDGFPGDRRRGFAPAVAPSPAGAKQQSRRRAQAATGRRQAGQAMRSSADQADRTAPSCQPGSQDRCSPAKW